MTKKKTKSSRFIAIREWLIKKGATRAERNLFWMAKELIRSKKGEPFTNLELKKVYNPYCHRTNMTQHLMNMVAKGLLVKHSRTEYLCAEPATEGRR